MSFLYKVNKSTLIELSYGYVIPYSQTKIQKGQFLLPFFLLVLKICDEQSDEQVMNNFLSKSQFETANVIVVKSSNTHQIFE